MTDLVVGIVGAGIMGSGISQTLAQTGHRVILLDVSQEILEHARKRIKDNLRLQRLARGGKRTKSPEKVLELVTLSTDIQLLSQTDYTIENVPESWETKEKVFAQLDAICAEHCILSSNTSAISITRLASLTKRAAKVIGTHFMNPVALTSTVEVVRGVHTSDETVDVTRQLLTEMGKECVIVNDSPGFVSNRVLMMTINEAIFLVQEQVAPAKDIDRIFKKCFGHKMGPLETADLIGLDCVLSTMEVLYEGFKDSKYRPCPLLYKMVHAGWHGQKSGRGFYIYPTGDPQYTGKVA